MSDTDGLAGDIRKATDELFRRFVSPRGYVLDFAGPNGEVHYQTPEEYRQNKPNALAWFTPTENGAFFTGLVLAGLVNQWEREPDPLIADRAAQLAAGLLTLGTVGARAGFVARSVAEHDDAHPIAGSDDQTVPWFYGLWRYVQSSMPGADERQKLVAQIIRTGHALRATGWSMPCDSTPSYGYRNTFSHHSFIHGARMLFVHRILAELDTDNRDEWLLLYYERLHERDYNKGPSRVELLEEGMGYAHVGGWTSYPRNPPFWISASAQAGLREMHDLETDAELKARFAAGLRANAIGALQHIHQYRWYRNDDRSAFNIDWRFLNEKWEPQTTIEQSLAVAERQRGMWARANPRKHHEDAFVREPMFAAWVAALCPAPDVRKQVVELTRAAAAHYDWSTMYTSSFFAVTLSEF